MSELRDEVERAFLPGVVGPMRHIFGDETADALEVLLPQEVEAVLLPLIERKMAEARALAFLAGWRARGAR